MFKPAQLYALLYAPDSLIRYFQKADPYRPIGQVGCEYDCPLLHYIEYMFKAHGGAKVACFKTELLISANQISEPHRLVTAVLPPYLKRFLSILAKQVKDSPRDENLVNPIECLNALAVALGRKIETSLFVLPGPVDLDSWEDLPQITDYECCGLVEETRLQGIRPYLHCALSFCMGSRLKKIEFDLFYPRFLHDGFRNKLTQTITKAKRGRPREGSFYYYLEFDRGDRLVFPWQFDIFDKSELMQRLPSFAS